MTDLSVTDLSDAQQCDGHVYRSAHFAGTEVFFVKKPGSQNVQFFLLFLSRGASFVADTRFISFYEGHMPAQSAQK